MSEPTGAYSKIPDPPKRRFNLTIHAGADDTDGLLRILAQIDCALSERPDQERQIVSGGGWDLHLTKDPDAPTGDDFDPSPPRLVAGQPRGETTAR